MILAVGHDIDLEIDFLGDQVVSHASVGNAPLLALDIEVGLHLHLIGGIFDDIGVKCDIFGDALDGQVSGDNHLIRIVGCLYLSNLENSFRMFFDVEEILRLQVADQFFFPFTLLIFIYDAVDLMLIVPWCVAETFLPSQLRVDSRGFTVKAAPVVSAGACCASVVSALSPSGLLVQEAMKSPTVRNKKKNFFMFNFDN